MQAARNEVAEYAEAYGWPLIEEMPTNDDRVPEITWRISSTVNLHYAEDDATGCSYVYVTAGYRDQCQAFCEHAEQHLNFWPREQLLAQYDSSSNAEERAGMLLMLALASTQRVDTEGQERIMAALRDPAEDVREAAIYATSYTPDWRYRPLLESVAESDPVEELRDDARNMLATYDEAGIR
ncbi:HEAT repeat domain-containing protein [Streptomyces sp. NPDC047453]|uniref:HEAT repeat domain-containing protein n=1 Tax=Streptomyces sp. NPDC047453 TaxID=3154812 RepID=UPI0033F934C2